MKTGFIVQARLGSTRLPGKIMLPFYKDECILDMLLKKLEKFADVKLVVATSLSVNDDRLAEYLNHKNINVYRGSEEDVLQRFIDAAEANGIDKAIRICSDNPFMDEEGLEELINAVSNSNADYIGFRVNNKPTIKTHFGFWGEYVSLSVLKKVTTFTNEKIYHEHVTNYIYSHPEKFKIEWIETPSFLQNRNDIRLTIDTTDDFKTAQYIYNNLKSNKDLSIKNIIFYLDNHPNLLSFMQKQINNNSK